jgi:hypothetical protein
MGHLADALAHVYRMLGFDHAAGGDEVFAQLVLARVIEPASKLDSLRVLEEAGLAGPSYATLKRRLPVYAKEAWRQKLSAACAAPSKRSTTPADLRAWYLDPAHALTRYMTTYPGQGLML